MTEGSLPGLISQPSKIFKSYQIQMQNVNFTCITLALRDAFIQTRSKIEINLRLVLFHFGADLTRHSANRLLKVASTHL